jgi:hypothetical protein
LKQTKPTSGMDKIKAKIASLRQEADAANDRADDLVE